jgi:hypothetical protein
MSGIINGDIVGMARVDVANNAATYGYANGFETGTPEGATAGSPAIERVGTGDFILYLDDQVEYGSATQQGGLVAMAISADTGVVVPSIRFCTVAHGDTTGEDAAYVGVDNRKKIHVYCYTHAGALSDPTGFTVIVFRNPVTLFP